MSSPKYILATLSVVVAVLASFLITKDINANTIITLLDGNSDFSISDFYNRVEANRGEKTVDPNVVVVNIDSVFDRAALAALLEDVEHCHPKVVGIDALFVCPKDASSDSVLVSTLNRYSKNIVLATQLDDETQRMKSNFAIQSVLKARWGVVNLVSKGSHGVVRTYRPLYVAKDTFPSFALSVCECMNAPLRLTEEVQHIYYSDHEFVTINPSEVKNYADVICGKVVLLGTIDEASDLHVTPLSMDYPGVLIHANIISNMLDGMYLTVVDDILNWSIGVLLAIGMAFFYISLSGRKSKPVVIRLTLVALVVVGIVLGCFFYSVFRVSINVPKILLIVALGQLTLDVYFACEDFLTTWLFKKTKK